MMNMHEVARDFDGLVSTYETFLDYHFVVLRDTLAFCDSRAIASCANRHRSYRYTFTF